MRACHNAISDAIRLAVLNSLLTHIRIQEPALFAFCADTVSIVAGAERAVLNLACLASLTLHAKSIGAFLARCAVGAQSAIGETRLAGD